MEKQRAEEEPAQGKDAAWGGAGGSGRTVPWSCVSELSRLWGCVFTYKPFMAEFALIAAGREMA